MANSYFAGSVWCNIDIALRRIEPVYRLEAQTFGLSVIEWYVLRALYEQDGQMPSRLAEAVGRPATSFTPILDEIEHKGFIERRQHTSDRRAIKIHLTAQGKALEEQVKVGAERLEKRVHLKLFEKDLRGFEVVMTDLQAMTRWTTK